MPAVYHDTDKKKFMDSSRTFISPKLMQSARRSMKGSSPQKNRALEIQDFQGSVFRIKT